MLVVIAWLFLPAIIYKFQGDSKTSTPSSNINTDSFVLTKYKTHSSKKLGPSNYKCRCCSTQKKHHTQKLHQPITNPLHLHHCLHGNSFIISLAFFLIIWRQNKNPMRGTLNQRVNEWMLCVYIKGMMRKAHTK